MKLRLAALVIGVIAVALIAAACGDDGTGSDAGPISGVGPGISVEEALDSDLDEPLLVNGFLHVQNGVTRLCAVLAESFPPQCGRPFLVVAGLDLTKIEGLISEGAVTWSESIQVLGTVEGDVLTVVPTSKASVTS